MEYVCFGVHHVAGSYLRCDSTYNDLTISRGDYYELLFGVTMRRMGFWSQGRA